MKNAFILISFILITSCSKKIEQKERTYENFPIKQLVKTEFQNTKSDGGFFLITGGHSSSTVESIYIKMMVETSPNIFTLLCLDLKNNLDHVFYIEINNDVSLPYLKIDTTDRDSRNKGRLSKENLIIGLNEGKFFRMKLYLVCPEKYLPEQLLPLTL
jgi:hypothetical protein